MNGPDSVPKRAKSQSGLEVPKVWKRKVVDEAQAGDIVLINGIEDIGIGTTLCDPAAPEALPLLPC